MAVKGAMDSLAGEYVAAGHGKGAEEKIDFWTFQVGQYSVVNHKGEAVGGKYDSVGDPRDIDGRIAFKAIRGDREFVVNEKADSGR